MRVYPDDSHLPTETLSDSSTSAHDSANGDGVIPTESEDETALGGVGVDLRGKRFGDSGDSAGVPHVTMRRVGLG